MFKSEEDKQAILVVDDAPENIEILREVLKGDYKVKAALNGERALKIAATAPRPDMILLDVMLPDMDGYEVCRRLKQDPQTAAIPVIFITAKNETEAEERGLALGAVDYLSKPISPPIVAARVRTHLALYDQNRELERKVLQRTQELRHTQLEIIRDLGRAAEFKDNETGLHVVRMSHYSRLLAESLNYGSGWDDLVLNAAPMHDIGKIGIPDAILLKRAKLEPEEWAQMRKHPEIGATIIGKHESELLRMAREIALSHHEKWNGSGYPYGLKGNEIPVAGRIIAIADVFDALTTERPYKKAWEVEAAVKFIDEQAGTHFDPALVRRFHEVLPAVLEVKEKYDEPEFANSLLYSHETANSLATLK